METNEFKRSIVFNFNESIEYSEGGSMKSTEIWSKFKKDNMEISKDMDADKFKKYISDYVSLNNLIKPKTKSGALEITNMKWRENHVLEVKTEKVKVDKPKVDKTFFKPVYDAKPKSNK